MCTGTCVLATRRTARARVVCVCVPSGWGRPNTLTIYVSALSNYGQNSLSWYAWTSRGGDAAGRPRGPRRARAAAPMACQCHGPWPMRGPARDPLGPASEVARARAHASELSVIRLLYDVQRQQTSHATVSYRGHTGRAWRVLATRAVALDRIRVSSPRSVARSELVMTGIALSGGAGWRAASVFVSWRTRMIYRTARP